MDRQMGEITSILKEEAGIFERIYSLERTKTSAIIEHNGSLLEKLSREQEGLVSSIMALETLRMNHILEYKKETHDRHQGITLNDMTEKMKGAEAAHVRVIGRSLKEVMERLRRLQDTNRVLINDNMEYYNILMTGLRRSGPLDTAYGRDGREEEKLKNSILFNKTA